MFRLIIEDDEGHTTVVPLVREEITIGRKEGNTIRLTERNVSRHHARLIRSNGSVFIEDLDSYNGVKVNGDRITVRTNVREGDLVEIGDYHFAIQWAAEEAAARGAHSSRTEPPPPLPPAAAPFAPASDDETAVVRVPAEQKRSDSSKANVIPANEAGRLVVTTTELAGTFIKLDKTEMTVGRADDCDIVIAHRSVSSRHAKMIYDGGIYRVVDLDSANGILVNGEEYARVDIRKGDIIELGHVRMRYVAPGEDFVFVAEEPTEQRRLSAGISDDKFSVERKPRSMMTWILLTIGVMAAVAIGFGVYQWVKKPSTGLGASGDQGNQGQNTAGNSTEDPATTDYLKGLDLYKARDLGGAKGAFVAALGKNPNHNGAKNYLEKVQKEQSFLGNLEKAKRAIQERDWDVALDELRQVPAESIIYPEVEKLTPEVSQKYKAYHLDLAKKLKEQDSLEEARRQVEAVLVEDGNNAIAINLKKNIDVLLAARKQQHAVVIDKKNPDKPPKDPAPEPKIDRAKEAAELWIQGRAAYSEKRHNDAILILSKVIKLNPAECAAYIALGGSYVGIGERSKALSVYEKFVQMCPSDPRVPQAREAIRQYKEQQKNTSP